MLLGALYVRRYHMLFSGKHFILHLRKASKMYLAVLKLRTGLEFFS